MQCDIIGISQFNMDKCTFPVGNFVMQMLYLYIYLEILVTDNKINNTVITFRWVAY